MRRVRVQTLDRQGRLAVLFRAVVMIARDTRLQCLGPAPVRHGLTIRVRQQ